eukprot:GFYU01010657.1.p1 GENE.GFYU01010657.1~~GFYU01010657.1.p1  ORF type:complete len:543 (-),score=161.24 GFYU01010657.1:684-2312(-)
MVVISVLDYGAGNVRSVYNAVKSCGCDTKLISTVEEINNAERLVFPGVGSFGSCMETLQQKGFIEPLKKYIADDRPFFGICLGLQTLFEGSEETPGVAGLGVIKGQVKKFEIEDKHKYKVPHMGWNGIRWLKENRLSPAVSEDRKVYFVHSFHASVTEDNKDWILGVTDYARTTNGFVSVVGKGNVFATQFHPEKSSSCGLDIIKCWLSAADAKLSVAPGAVNLSSETQLAKRVIACLDVRTNDKGELIVTKGDQYDVRDASEGQIRDLGDPVHLAKRYSDDGADEVTFLNITAFRNCVVSDLPMRSILERSSEHIFVPLTVGGGIRDYTDMNGNQTTALDIARTYFAAGADKVSIGSDAVIASEDYRRDGVLTGKTGIEQISNVYGKQAVVVSIDPKRAYVKDPSETTHNCVKLEGETGPNGEEYCWYQCTVKGGREVRDIDAVEVAMACEAMGAGEILLNCIDRDGTNKGFDNGLVSSVRQAVTIPVIASSGAGKVEHFAQVFEKTAVDAALAAGIFHRREVEISAVKQHLHSSQIPTRL